jgi:O-antigen/teichoic acid export membrane protein
MAMVIGLTSSVFSREIILFLSNDSFTPGKSALIILGFVPMFIFICGLLGELMIAYDMRRALIRNSTFILIFNVVLNLVLIPRYSFTGAAASTLISEIVLISITYLTVQQFFTIRVEFYRLCKMIFFALVAACFAFLLKPHLYFLINLSFTLIVFTALSYLTDSLPKTKVDDYLKLIKSKLKI